MKADRKLPENLRMVRHDMVWIELSTRSRGKFPIKDIGKMYEKVEQAAGRLTFSIFYDSVWYRVVCYAVKLYGITSYRSSSHIIAAVRLEAYHVKQNTPRLGIYVKT